MKAKAAVADAAIFTVVAPFVFDGAWVYVAIVVAYVVCVAKVCVRWERRSPGA